MSNLIDVIEKEGMRTDLPKLAIGDTVKVFVKVVEGNKERLQAFEGIIIAFRGKIDHIDIIRHGKVRRAKLYYLRQRSGKAAKLAEVIK